MLKKLPNIVLLILIGSCFTLSNLQAQEGGDLQEKSEEPVSTSKDSIPEEDLSTPENRSDVTPGTPLLGPINALDSKSLENQLPSIPLPQNRTEEEKPETEQPSQHTFNFMHFLFYKFKLVDIFGD